MRTKYVSFFLLFLLMSTLYLFPSFAQDTPHKVLRGHTSAVYSIAFSRDGKTLASGSYDKTVRLWDVATGREKATFRGHTDRVNSVAFSPDGWTLASGSGGDNTVRLWDVATGREKANFTKDEGVFVLGFFSVSFSPDGQTLASGSNDGTVRLWDVATGRERTKLTGHTEGVVSVSFSPLEGQTLASGSLDDTVRLWDVGAGDDVAPPTGLPYLILESPRVSKSTVAPGESFTFYVTVKNTGAAESGTTTLRYHRSDNNTISTNDTEVGTDTVGGLGPPTGSRNTAPKEITLTAPTTPRTYYYGACTDNGCSAAVRVTVEVIDQPDLVVQSPWVSHSTLGSGESFRFGVTVKNIGRGEAAPTTLRYYRSDDETISTSDTAVGTDDVGRLAHTGTSTEEITLTAPTTPGTYYYGACVDTATTESDTGNNCSTGFEITVSAPDDHADTRDGATPLEVVGTVLRGSNKIEVDDDVDYFQLIVNGDGQLTVETTGSLDTTGTLENSSGTALASSDDDGDSRNFRIQHAVTSGAYYLKVESYGSSTGEYTVKANLAIVTLKSDLVVRAPSVNKTTLPAGESFTFSVTVANVGRAESDGTTLRYYRSGDDIISAADTEVGTDSVEGLNLQFLRGGTSTKSLTLTAPTTPGTYYYGACVDAANESNTDNNCSTAVAVTVTPLNTVVRVTPDTLTQGVGEPVTLKIDVADVQDVIGYNFTLTFDPSVLQILSSRNGNYLPGAVGRHLSLPPPTVTANSVTLSALNIQGYESSGGGTLAYVTFKVRGTGTSTLSLSEVELTLKGGSTVVSPRVEDGQIIGTVLPPQQNIVKLIYFMPKDRSPQADIDEKIDTLIRDAQQFFGEQMEEKNIHVRKTFTFETDVTGEATVHQVKGKLTNDEYHENTWQEITSEVEAIFETSRSLFFITAELDDSSICGLGGPHLSHTSGLRTSVTTQIGGIALIPASGSCFESPITAYHELGHAFGLLHDFRSITYIMSYGGDQRYQLSHCTTEWLDASRFFNSNQPLVDDEITTIQRLPVLANPQKTINFTITDVDGLHQAQLIVAPKDETPPPGYPYSEEKWRNLSNNNKRYLHACKRLNGESDTVEFSIDGLNADEVMIQVIDKYGNFVRQRFSLASTDDHGDTRAEASPIYIGESNTGEISSPGKIATGDDIDFYSIEASGPGIVTAYTTGNLDTVGELQDSSGTVLKSADDVRNDLNFRIQHRVTAGTYYIKISSYEAATGSYTLHASFEPDTPDTWADVNGDGTVDIQDLVYIAEQYKQTGKNDADVNGDGVVDVDDFVLVAAVVDDGAAGAPAMRGQVLEAFTVEEIQQILSEARSSGNTSPAYLSGIAVLEQFLALLIAAEAIPEATSLLPNYPNPFNPETWIPYQLAEPAAVTLTIYDIHGRVVRDLDLGYQRAGMYHMRRRAAFWDGKNAQGEPVASGVYFYTLTAGDFSATRKMLIRK